MPIKRLTRAILSQHMAALSVAIAASIPRPLRRSDSYFTRQSLHPAFHPRHWRYCAGKRICACWQRITLLSQEPSIPRLLTGRPDVRSVSGGLLLQTPDAVGEQETEYAVVTEREPTLEEVTDLMFAWKVVRHVKSNAIVLAHKLAVVGVGAGQMNRVASVQLAVEKAAERARGSVLASDAFFPFADGVEAAAKAGVTAIIQPGGSIRDEEAIRMANRYAVAMVFTGSAISGINEWRMRGNHVRKKRVHSRALSLY